MSETSPDTSSDAAAAEQPHRRRWGLRILAGAAVALAVVIVGAAGYVAYLWFRIPSDSFDPVTPGRLDVAAEAAGSTPLGDFTVQVAQGDAAGVTITQVQQVVWRSPTTTAFLGAGVGEVEWTEKFGYFWADVDRRVELLDQQIASVEQAGSDVVLRGTLTGKDDDFDGGEITAPYRLTLSTQTKGSDSEVVRIDVEVGALSNGDEATSVVLTNGLDSGEQVHGFGEQYRDFNLVGSTFGVLVQEQGIGRGEQPITTLADLTNWAGGNAGTTYAAWPTYVTSGNRSFALADVASSGGFGIADLSRDGQVTLETWADEITAEVTAADSPKELMAARAAGRTFPPLADFSQRGAVLGLQGGTDKVRQVVAEMEQSGAAISGVWLQDWVGKRQTSFGSQLWWTWELDREQYPGWEQLVAELNAQGIEVLTYVNPFIADAADKGVPGMRNLYAEAEQQGFLIKDAEGGTYIIETVGFPVAMMDLTNPAAREWYADVIATDVLGVGARGFMADFGEALPFDAVLFDGDPLQVHNRYPQLWAQTVRMACDKAGQPDCLAFMRSSFLDSPSQVPMQWAGDQMVDFAAEDGLASVVLGMNAGGVSGNPLWHSDIGGYTSINAVVKNYVRPSNLNARWAEMQAFGTMMRTHETNRPDVNQQVYDTPETRAAFARATQIFVALADYRAGVIDEALRTGVPAMRHTWLVYPGTEAADADLQFFLGDHLLMAPVTSNDATSTEVSLPPGEWVHAFTGEQFSGDQTVTVPSPLGTPAAFVRADDPVGAQIREALTDAGLTTG